MNIATLHITLHFKIILHAANKKDIYTVKIDKHNKLIILFSLDFLQIFFLSRLRIFSYFWSPLYVRAPWCIASVRFLVFISLNTSIFDLFACRVALCLKNSEQNFFLSFSLRRKRRPLLQAQ